MKSGKENLVTIGICVYNGERFLAEAIESALAQTHENVEVIVFDDDSTDATREIATAFEGPRMTVIRSQPNLGLGYGRRLIQAIARGAYLTWLDSDDVFCVDRIETLMRHARRSKAKIICDCYRCITEDGMATERTFSVPQKLRSEPHFTRLFERNAMIPHPLIHKSCFRSIKYDTVLRASQDYDYWLKCSYAGVTFSCIDEIGLHYRQRRDSLSSDVDRSRRYNKTICEKYNLFDLASLYRQRGFSDAIINYMATLQCIHRDDYERALEFAQRTWPDEQDVDQDFYLSALFLRTGNLEKAEFHLEKHLARHPGSPAGHNNMAVLCRMQGKDGEHWLRQALASLPDYVDARRNLEGFEPARITDTFLSPVMTNDDEAAVTLIEQEGDDVLQKNQV